MKLGEVYKIEGTKYINVERVTSRELHVEYYDLCKLGKEDLWSETGEVIKSKNMTSFVERILWGAMKGL